MQATITDDKVHAHGVVHRHIHYGWHTIDSTFDERLPVGIRTVLVVVSILGAPFIILCFALTSIVILSGHFFAKAMSIARVTGKLIWNQW